MLELCELEWGDAEIGFETFALNFPAVRGRETSGRQRIARRSPMESRSRSSSAKALVLQQRPMVVLQRADDELGSRAVPPLIRATSGRPLATSPERR